jgi:uncharacterized protein (DUF433 family)
VPNYYYIAWGADSRAPRVKEADLNPSAVYLALDSLRSLYRDLVDFRLPDARAYPKAVLVAWVGNEIKAFIRRVEKDGRDVPGAWGSFPGELEAVHPKPVRELSPNWGVIELSVRHLLAQIPEAETSPELRSGVPVLRGTRFPLSRVLAELADDSRISDLARDYDLEVSTLKGFLEGLARMFDRPV